MWVSECRTIGPNDGQLVRKSDIVSSDGISDAKPPNWIFRWKNSSTAFAVFLLMSCLLNCFVIVCNLVDVCGAVCNHHLAIRIILHPYFLTTWNIKLYYYVLGMKYQFLLSNNGLSSENACFTWWWYVNMYDFAQTKLVYLFDIHICRTINVLANPELCNNLCTY